MDETNKLRKNGAWYRRSVTGSKTTRHVVVPSEWVDAWRVVPEERGQETVNVMYFAEDNLFLTITPISPKIRNIATILVKDSTQIGSLTERNKIKRMTLAAYLVGYHEILIKNRRKEPLPSDFLKEMEQFTENKLCYAKSRVASGSSEITIRASMDWGRINVEKEIKEMCECAKTMHCRTIDLMKKFSNDESNDIVNMDDEVDKSCHFIVRLCKAAAQNPAILRFAGIKNFRYLMAYRVIAKSIERCADHATKMTMDLKELHKNGKKSAFDKKTSDAIESLSNDMIDVLDKAMSALFAASDNYSSAEAVIQRIDRILSTEERLLHKDIDKKTFSEEDLAKIWCQRRLAESIRRTLLYIQTIAEITLNLFVDSVIEKS